MARPAVLAHGFGIRYDLPVPLYLYLLGGGAVVILTFAVLGLFVRKPANEASYPRLRLSEVPGLRAVVLSRWPRVIGGVIGVFTLLTVVLTGLLGAGDATGNPAEFLVWIYFWAGTVVLSGLVGNLFALLNPWSALADLATWLRRRPPPPARLGYPRRLGLWPAVAGYAGFAWFELASGLSANPRALAGAALLYSAYTFMMMSLFGRDLWLARGEVFSVLFRFVGAFSPFEARCTDAEACSSCVSTCAAGQNSCVNCGECFRRAARREVSLRPWAVGLLDAGLMGWDVVAFVILALSSLAFDGFSATPPWASLVNATTSTTERLGSLGPVILRTTGLAAVTLLFMGVFVAIIRLVDRLGGGGSGIRTLSLFAYTLIPIALVYNAAHNYSYIVVQAQGIVPLLADPFHRGWHLLPTQGYQVSFALADAAVIWWIQIVLIVLGHMLAVYLAHVRALLLTPKARRALLGQVPMLALMVVYTMTSLWILAQPITEAG